MTAYNVISPGSLVAGQPEDVSVLLANLQAIAAVINGGIDNTNLAATAAIDPSKLASFPNDITKFLRGDGLWAAVSGIPAGLIAPYAGAAAPSGWLLADGSAVSRATYSDLFAAIGTAYGVGDGSTTFNLPDLRGRVAVGKGSNALVNTLGNNDGVTEANRRPKHRHTPHTHTPSPATFAREQGGTNSYNGPNVAVNMATLTIGTSDGGSGVATDSLDAPAYQVVNFMIKT